MKITTIFIVLLFSKPIDVSKDKEVAEVVKSCLGTKMLAKWMDLAVKIALDAVKTVSVTRYGHQEIDIKRYCRIEKVFLGFFAFSILLFWWICNFQKNFY